MPADNGMQEDILISKKDINIDRDDVLGRGGYGHVFAGYMTDGKKVAVKLLIEQGALPERHIKDLRKESEKLKELTNHPNIIDLIGIIMEPDNYGLILEYMHFGTAFEFVGTFEVGLPLLLRMTCQVASAMMFLHTSHDPPMLHLDLKADNILIDKHFDAKVSDFGLSEWKTVTQMVTKGGSTSSRRCTITHIAPEILDNVHRKSTDRLDIYAFGITIWELFATDRPYGNVKESVIAEAVKNEQRPDLECLSANCPDIIRLMISKCWHHKPEKRPAFTVIFYEMQKAFETHQAGLNKALKAIRRQILEKYNVNDPQCLDTEYLDDLELGEEPEEMDYVTMETENRPVGEEMNLGPAEKERQPQQEQTESEQSNSLSGLKHMKMEDDNEPMEMSNSESREATIASKVKVEDAKTEGGTNQQKETKKEEKTAENQKKMQKMIEEARRKSEEEQRKRQKEQRKKWEQEKKRQEEERRKEEKKQKQEDNRKKKSDKGPNADQKADIKTENQNTGGRGGILGSLFGVFRGYHKESLIDSDTNRVPIPDQHDSLQSMDTHSIEADEMSSPGDDGSKLPVRSHGVPLQPRPGASPNLPSPTLKREPGTGNSNQQKADKSSPEQGPSNRASGGWDPPPRQTPPTGGATGVGGATGRAQNITISHAHAGGGFSHITIDPNMPTQPNIQVGNSNLMVIGGDTDSDEQERRENTNKTQKKKRRHREIKLPDQPLDMDRLDKVCIGIGKDWKKLCRELGLDDPLIEQIQEDYHINGTYEIMYQALHKWMQKNGKAATIKALGQHLCNIDRDDLMKKLK